MRNHLSTMRFRRRFGSIVVISLIVGFGTSLSCQQAWLMPSGIRWNESFESVQTHLRGQLAVRETTVTSDLKKPSGGRQTWKMLSAIDTLEGEAVLNVFAFDQNGDSLRSLTIFCYDRNSQVLPGQTIHADPVKLYDAISQRCKGSAETSVASTKMRTWETGHEKYMMIYVEAGSEKMTSIVVDPL